MAHFAVVVVGATRDADFLCDVERFVAEGVGVDHVFELLGHGQETRFAVVDGPGGC